MRPPPELRRAAHRPEVAQHVARLRERDGEPLRVREVEHGVQEHREGGGEVWLVCCV